ncbi:MAG: caspase family protein [Chthonomonas sp.]|nr:caspase family protein [Chthonomonas sp.]
MKVLQTLIAIAVAAAPLAANAESYAYLVGIKDYPTPLDAQGNPLKDEKGNVVDNDLAGPINDCNSIMSLLNLKYGYNSSNIRKSFDKDATGKNFLENIKWLATTAKAGDNVVFYYSGHGAQLEDDKAKEPTPGDKIDETLVLADGTLVIDDLFDEVKGILTANGVNVTFVFDSCFSGGMSREFMVNGRSAREKFLGKKQTGANYKSMSRAMMNNWRPSIDSIKTRATFNPTGTAAWIYASKETEPSVDLGAAGADSPAHGLFTLLLTAVLEAEPKSPAKDLVDAINEFATEKGFKQGPNTEFSNSTRANQPVFLSN